MRRLLLLIVSGSVAGWLLWAISCERDDYRDTLPLRSFDAAPVEAGAPVDLARPDLVVADGGGTDAAMRSDAGDAGGGGDAGGATDARTD